MMKSLLVLALAASGSAAIAQDSGFPDTNVSWRAAPAPLIVAALQQVTVGVRKQQVFQVLGAPHFDEGIFARKWNYWFISPGKESCQLQIRFGKKSRISAIKWNSPSCQKASTGDKG
jgi:outer membrane protein assembly factor BamE (lipoprotein component of BamABCDE complex)